MTDLLRSNINLKSTLTYEEATAYYEKADTSEKLFINAWLRFKLYSPSYQRIHEVILWSLQYIPGEIYPNASAVYEKLINKFFYPYKDKNFTLADCHYEDKCAEDIIETVREIKSLNTIYSIKEFNPGFATQRVDLRLGQLLRSFAGFLMDYRKLDEVVGGWFYIFFLPYLTLTSCPQMAWLVLYLSYNFFLLPYATAC